MKATNTSSFSIFTIASAYIGTVVGAGFASGQEVLRFFNAYGIIGILGIAISTFLFFFVAYTVLMLGRNLKAKSHVDIVLYTNGDVCGSFIDVIIIIFLFAGLSAMIAGAGAIFKEQFSISPILGTLAMALLTLFTVITGTKGVYNAISYVVPFLIVSVLFISIYSLLNNPITNSEIQIASDIGGATPNWLVSSINYASYNLVVAIAVLTPMGPLAKDKKKLFWGALLGALGLGICMVAIYFCLMTNITSIYDMEVPMIEIARKISPVAKVLFAIVLFAEVYTTAVGNLYGFIRRIPFRISKTYLVIITTLLAFIVGQLGFSNMVRYLYPVVGYGGLIFLAGIIYVWIAKRKSIV